jgi:hypothetical protein
MLQPSYTLTLGNQRWTNQALAIDLELGTAPLVDRLEIRFPFAAPVSAATGDHVSLSLNNGEKSGDVFGGVVMSIGRTLGEIRVTAVNSGGTLAQYRPAATYESVTAGTVIRNLCGEANVDVASVEDGVSLAFFVADGSRSAWDHIARVCGWSGSIARVNSDNEVEAPVLDATTPDLALRYGRELLTITNTEFTRGIESFTVVGESGAGDTGSNDAFRLSTDFFQGNAPDAPSPTSRWRTEPALRTVEGAARAGASRTRSYKSSGQRGVFNAFLQPGLRPGTIVQIQDLPSGLPAGPLWLYSVHHRLRADGALTSARYCQGGDSFNPAGLLGALKSLVGGL